MKIKFGIILIVLLLLPISRAFADIDTQTTPPSLNELKKMDSDTDGLSNYDEIYIYHTDVHNKDSDGDGYTDGDEVKNGYDPNKSGDDKLQKNIRVRLADQSLAYGLGDYVQGSFKISSGLSKTPTPSGSYQVLKKVPVIDYRGADYDFKNTKWNLMFKRGTSLSYYIHGAYWHNSFGTPKSHGCINVSYANMESLYNWADVGTQINIE